MRSPQDDCPRAILNIFGWRVGQCHPVPLIISLSYPVVPIGFSTLRSRVTITLKPKSADRASWLEADHSQTENLRGMVTTVWRESTSRRSINRILFIKI